MMSDEDDLRAAEYVLGTLPERERLDARSRIDVDPIFARAVAAWEQRLAPLADETAPVAVPPQVWKRIEAELAVEAIIPRVDRANRLVDSAGPQVDVIDLAARMRRWRLRAVTAMAASLLLAVGLGYQMLVPLLQGPVDGRRFVAVVNRDASLPALIVDVDTGLGEITVRPVSAEPPPADKSLELWVIPAGGSPLSLGLVDPAGGVRRVADKLGSVRSDGTFAVTVEPKGGAPEGVPTGPIVYSGKLVAVDR